MAETEQNKTEEATPFKLKRAREKGTVARGADLGFFSCLIALGLFSLAAGGHAIQELSALMRRTLQSTHDASDPQRALSAALSGYPAAVQTVALLGVTVILIVVFLEILQVRGITFSAQPLKPDFSRLNPAKGLKRLFTVRLLKETLKNVIKLAAYAAATYFVVRHSFEENGRSIADASSLIEALRASGLRLLASFALLALIFAALDQVLVRGEFRKQMRMTRSELKREFREREGEPRQKQKRKQLHAEFSRQTRALSALPGSDMLIVNPQHYAVALTYNAKTMSAPTIKTKGRNHFALLLKRRATELSIPIIEHPPLARALYRSRDSGEEIGPNEYRAVADLYLNLLRSRASTDATHAVP